jgi:hypothetical protein
MDEPRLRIKITADERISFTAMFEPTGMTRLLYVCRRVTLRAGRTRSRSSSGRAHLDLGAGRGDYLHRRGPETA